MTQRQQAWLAILVGLFALGQFQRSATSVMAEGIQADLGLSAASLSMLVAMMFYANVVAQLPAGAALDRIGPRRLLILGSSAIAVGTALFATAETYGMGLAARGLIGVGSAVMLPCTYVLIGRNFPAAEFGRINGQVITFGSVGGLLATYPLALLVAQTGWRFPLFLLAGAAAILAVASFLQPRTEAADVATDADVDTGPEHLHLPTFVALCILGFVSFAPITVFTGLWGGPWLTDRYGVSLSTAGAVLFAYFAITLVGAWVYGQLDYRLQARRALIFGSVGVSILCLFTLFLWPAMPITIAVAILGAMIFCQQFYIPLGAAMKSAVPEAMLARMTGIFGLISVLGIPVMQGVTGQVLQSAQAQGLSPAESYAWLFASVGAAMTICVVLSGLIMCVAKPGQT